MSINETIKKIKVATAFSGGLAAVEFALRYEDINHEIVFACEWDKYARQSYLNFHGAPGTFYNDISDLDANKYKNKIDLFVWGSPCQDLSLAGKRKGFDGAKSSLFREGARVQKEMMPRNFIFENVKGLLSSNGGADYKEVLETFRDQGYHIVTLVMNTKDYGVPQNRERVFIVGFLDVNEYHEYKEPKAFKLETRLRDILEDSVDEKYLLSDKSIVRLSTSDRSIGPGNKDTEIANCLIAQYSKLPTDGFYVSVKQVTKKGFDVAGPGDSINISFPKSLTRRGRVGKGVAQTLDCNCSQAVIAEQRADEGLRFFKNGVCGTLRTIDACGDKRVVTKSNIRKLTPKEFYRLQGLKDEDINLVVSDTQAYKIAGNAISVNVMQELLKSLYKKERSSISLFDFMGAIA